ncbi:MAG: lactate racemase domain-containing protein, partial [Candidatus Zixiibacteriota bacterium]
MKIDLKYGNSHRTLELDDKNVIGILELTKVPGLPDVTKAEIEALQNPIGTERLFEIAKGKTTACVVVSDYTRGTPYKRSNFNLLLPIIEQLHEG